MFSFPGVYVLKLQNDCYYVGSSNNISERLSHHKDGEGCAWTKLNPLQCIYSVYPTNQDLRVLEEEITYDTMTKFGIAKVRGASFIQVNMPVEEHEAIAKLLLHRQDKCLKCGQSGHYVNKCPVLTSVEKHTGFWGWVQTGLKVAQEANRSENKEQKCFKCGRSGHFAKNCYAKHHINGKTLHKT